MRERREETSQERTGGRDGMTNRGPEKQGEGIRKTQAEEAPEQRWRETQRTEERELKRHAAR